MKLGEVWALKTTGELVVVIGTINTDDTIHVRRPVMGSDGVTHKVETYWPFELEPTEDHLRREAHEQLNKMIIQKSVIGDGIRKYEAEHPEPEDEEPTPEFPLN